MATKINKAMFTGSGRVFDGTLGGIIVGLAQQQAVGAIVAAELDALTDNTGGTADGVVSAIPLPANHVLSGTDSAQKAALETALGTAKDALTEIVARISELQAVVPAFGTITNSVGGTAADGTVSAVTASVSGVGTSLASAAGARAAIKGIADAIAKATFFTNKLAAATGAVPLSDQSGGSNGVSGISTTFGAISTGTGTAVDGSNATDKAGISAADASAALAAIRDGCKELVVKLNEIAAKTPSLTVVVDG